MVAQRPVFSLWLSLYLFAHNMAAGRGGGHGLTDINRPSHVVSVSLSWWVSVGDTESLTLCGHSHRAIHKYMCSSVKSGLPTLTSRHHGSDFPDESSDSLSLMAAESSARIPPDSFRRKRRNDFSLFSRKGL